MISTMTTSADRNNEALRIAEEIVATRARLALLVDKFNSLVNAPSAAPIDRSSTGDNAARHAVPDSNASAASRIMAVFERQPGKKVTTQAVATELSDLDVALVRSTISRFGRTGKLKQVKRGIYKFIAPAGEEDSKA